ncbi:hypothetical protein R3P38DRAFT_2781575 [Favolaschia claudopus]|uniref:Uncharacterized protein n=1 Tax=Favolaschia claudopus TaxID=2862362 RepID=A0AAW0B7Q8_9AGAR
MYAEAERKGGIRRRVSRRMILEDQYNCKRPSLEQQCVWKPRRSVRKMEYSSDLPPKGTVRRREEHSGDPALRRTIKECQWDANPKTGTEPMLPSSELGGGRGGGQWFARPETGTMLMLPSSYREIKERAVTEKRVMVHIWSFGDKLYKPKCNSEGSRWEYPGRHPEAVKLGGTERTADHERRSQMCGIVIVMCGFVRLGQHPYTPSPMAIDAVRPERGRRRQTARRGGAVSASDARIDSQGNQLFRGDPGF